MESGLVPGFWCPEAFGPEPKERQKEREKKRKKESFGLRTWKWSRTKSLRNSKLKKIKKKLVLDFSMIETTLS